jgi:hypothetical protein
MLSGATKFLARKADINRLRWGKGASSSRPKRHIKAAGPSIQLEIQIDRPDIHPGVRCPRSETCRAKGMLMELPQILQGESITRLLQGAAVGVVATLIVGFQWGGWVTGGTAKEMAQKSANTALVTALAPICVDKFQRSAQAAANLTELKKVSSWQQGDFISKGGWATMPGSDAANSAVADACAIMLGSLSNK